MNHPFNSSCDIANSKRFALGIHHKTHEGNITQRLTPN